MKKKLLFVIPALDLGGAEKSFVNLLNAIDYNRYEVDVFLMTRTGIFLDLIPIEVNILPQSQSFSDFSISFPQSLIKFLKERKVSLIFYKILFTLHGRFIKNPVIREQRMWKYLKHFFPLQPKKYDVAISYLEKTSGYYIIEKVKATEKIGWIHTDLEALGIDFNIENKYLAAFDFLVTVSEGLSERLRKKLPDFKSKILTIENINSQKIITSLSNEKIDFQFPAESINILYVGRLAQEKGLFNALDAVEILIKNGHNINWYLIGSGNKQSELQESAIAKGIDGNVHFLGIQNNPYPYIKFADVFLLSSFYEGKSISLEEAKILYKPIVITNFTSAKDQIVDNETGLIAEMNAESIAEKIELLINNKLLSAEMIRNLRNSSRGNEEEINKLYELID